MQKTSTIRTIFYLIRDSLSDIWSDLWTTLVCNAIWLLANLLVIPGPPATMALYYYANQKAHGEIVDHRDFWKAIWRSWRVGWRYGTLNFFILAFLAVDYYLSSMIADSTFMYYMQGLYIVLGVCWFSVQFFTLPFLFEQEKMRIRTALHNAVVLIGRNPWFSILLLLFLILILLVGTLVSLLSIMFGGIFIALSGSRATLNRLELLDAEKEFNPESHKNINDFIYD